MLRVDWVIVTQSCASLQSHSLVSKPQSSRAGQGRDGRGGGLDV